MNKNRGLSIIIPTYNEAGTIIVLLKRLLSPEVDKFTEVIVVDAQQSTDNLEEEISSFPVQFIKSKNTSRARQMNEGAKIAKHNILYFVHADAIPPKGFEKYILESIYEENQFGYFKYSFDSNKILLKINSYFSKYKSFYTGGGDQTFFIRKDLFNSMNGFDESLPLCEDFDIHSRLLKAKKKYEIIDEPVTISDRKYQGSNYIWVNLVNFYMLIRFKLGHNPNKLKTQYSKLIKNN